MKMKWLVLGVLDISNAISDPTVADKYRDLTISWSRYDYRGEIIEASSVDQILSRASDRRYQWCLILPYGHILAEQWTPEHLKGQDFFLALESLIRQDDFLVAGTIVEQADAWFGFENQCLLINLDMYRRLSAPAFDMAGEGRIDLPQPVRLEKQGRIIALLPSSETERQRPALDGWYFIATSLRNALPVRGFDEDLLDGMLNLSAKCSDRTEAFGKYLDHGLEEYRPLDPHPDLSADQTAFLDVVQSQTANARRGVFLWNIESYADIETPRDDFQAPVSSLYSVAAGFKPNRILQTHGWDDRTRVIYFDYSPRALEIRKYMVHEWDGQDFPDFVTQIFRAFPPPETFYQLWADLTPDRVTSLDIERMWKRELSRWKSARVFREHWQDYRQLDHHYVCCDLLMDPAPLLEQVVAEPSAVVWWSNAFFTMYGNWFYSLDDRRQMYDHWIQQIARLNPDLYLFGSDYNNISVNSLRAAEYWDHDDRAGGGYLIPCRLSKTQIRT